MKKFLIKCTLFGLIVILILSAIEISIRRIPNPYSFKMEWMDKNAKKIKTLVLGSSYANYGINPAFIGDSSFNLAMQGQSVKYDLALLKKYITRMPHLEKVILGIGYQIPFYWDYENSDILPGNRIYGAKYYIGWYKMYMGIGFDPFPAYSFEILSYRRAILKWKDTYIRHKNQMRCDSTGFDHEANLQERPKIWYQSESTIKNYTADRTDQERVFQLCKSYLEEMIFILKQHKAELIIVTTPTYYTFHENINKNQMNKVYKAVTELSEKNSNVFFYDYLSDQRFTDEDFYDSNHLSDVGAEKFSKILRDTLFDKKQTK